MDFEKLKEIKIENFIWIIYFFITISALVSNYYEEDYIKTKSSKDYRIFKNINVTLFTVAFFIYLYFVYLNYKNITNLRKNTSQKKVLYANINFIAAVLFLIGGILYLYTEINNNDIEIGDIAI